MDPVFSALTVLGLVALVYVPWQRTCTDYARQTIFKYRDDLFDLAYAGKLDFNSEHYKAIRNHLEANIRYAHELTLPRILFLIIARKARAKKLPARNDIAAVRHIEDETTRAAVKNIIYKSQLALAYMIIMKSPLTILLFPFAVYPFIVYKINARLYKLGVAALSKMIGVIQFETEGSDLSNNLGA